MHLDNMPQQPAYVVEQAKALDRKAAESGVDSIAPLSVATPRLDLSVILSAVHFAFSPLSITRRYGLLVPAKGTMATTDFPSSAGHGLLHDCYANQDADFVALLRAKHAVIMVRFNSFLCSGDPRNHAPICGRVGKDERAGVRGVGRDCELRQRPHDQPLRPHADPRRLLRRQRRGGRGVYDPTLSQVLCAVSLTASIALVQILRRSR